MSNATIYFDRECLRHQTGRGHPDSPRRLSAIMERLERDGLCAPGQALAPGPCPLDALESVHARDYIADLEARCREGRLFHVDPDTVGGPATFDAALRAAGAALAAADAVADGQTLRAFCAVRPPGHHAGAAQAMGFCFFNNVALAARRLQAHGLARIAIVDWDVHHGNGTQDLFYDDPTVLFISLHQYGLYLSSGRASECGAGHGRGYTLNVPLPRGASDRDYLEAFEGLVKPRIDTFRPDCLLVSAGFDAHEADPLGGMQVTTEGFRELTRRTLALARTHSAGRLVSVLEGGYDLAATAAAASAHVAVLAGA